MKNISIVTSILFVLSILIFLYYFSTKTIEVSTDLFEKEFKNSKVSHTMYSYNLLRIEGDNVFLSKKEMTPFFYKWREKILFTGVNHLSVNTQQEIHKNLKEKIDEVN